MKMILEEKFCVPVLKVAGSVQRGDGRRLNNRLVSLAAQGHQLIGLDLSDVHSMAEPEALCLFRARHRLARTFQSLRLVGLSPQVIEAMGAARASAS
jgi:hypothetical protein